MTFNFQFPRCRFLCRLIYWRKPKWLIWSKANICFARTIRLAYCGFTKCGRSHNAAVWAKKLGYTNVYRAPGGITVWKDMGLPYKVVPNANHVYPNK